MHSSSDRELTTYKVPPTPTPFTLWNPVKTELLSDSLGLLLGLSCPLGYQSAHEKLFWNRNTTLCPCQKASGPSRCFHSTECSEGSLLPFLRLFAYRSSFQGGQSLTTLFKVAPLPDCTLTPLFLLHFLRNTPYNFTYWVLLTPTLLYPPLTHTRCSINICPMTAQAKPQQSVPRGPLPRPLLPSERQGHAAGQTPTPRSRQERPEPRALQSPELPNCLPISLGTDPVHQYWPPAAALGCPPQSITGGCHRSAPRGGARGDAKRGTSRVWRRSPGEGTVAGTPGDSRQDGEHRNTEAERRRRGSWRPPLKT